MANEEQGKSVFLSRLEAIEEVTPATGFNLVGVDEYEPPGEELFMIAHYEDKDVALAALRQTKAADPSGVYYLYSAPGEEVIAADDPRAQVSVLEVVLLAGAEGGSYGLYRERGPDGRWQFFAELNQVALVDMCEEAGDPVPHERIVRSARVDTFEQGLALLDESRGCKIAETGWARTRREGRAHPLRAHAVQPTSPRAAGGYVGFEVPRTCGSSSRMAPPSSDECGKQRRFANRACGRGSTRLEQL